MGRRRADKAAAFVLQGEAALDSSESGIVVPSILQCRHVGQACATDADANHPAEQDCAALAKWWNPGEEHSERTLRCDAHRADPESSRVRFRVDDWPKIACISCLSAAPVVNVYGDGMGYCRACAAEVMRGFTGMFRKAEKVKVTVPDHEKKHKAWLSQCRKNLASYHHPGGKIPNRAKWLADLKRGSREKSSDGVRYTCADGASLLLYADALKGHGWKCEQAEAPADFIPFETLPPDAPADPVSAAPWEKLGMTRDEACVAVAEAITEAARAEADALLAPPACAARYAPESWTDADNERDTIEDIPVPLELQKPPVSLMESMLAEALPALGIEPTPEVMRAALGAMRGEG